MAFDDGLEDDSPVYRPLLPPDDRVWRHPSEVPPAPATAPAAGARMWRVALVSGLCGALLATGLAVAAGRLYRGDRVVERVVEVPAPVQLEPVSLDGGGMGGAAQKVRPAIVEVRAAGPHGPALASGVIFRYDGLVLTSHQAVATAPRLAVVGSDGREIAAALIGADPDTDVAVLELVGGGPWATAPMGSSLRVRAGQTVIALGATAGKGRRSSMSVGFVDAVDRTVDRRPPLADLVGMLQVDTPVAPGGALLDASGVVVGIVAGGEASGFAIRIDVALAVAGGLISGAHVGPGWLGVEGSDLDPAVAAAMALPGGALVTAVVGGGPAAAAGLRGGDVIVAVAGAPVPSMAALVAALRGRAAGDRVRIAYRRGGAGGEVDVTLARRP